MRISFIICYYQGYSSIFKALDSLNDEFLGNNNVEIIVVENGKFVEERIKNKFINTNIHFLPIQTNIGLGNARNFGFKMAKGDLVYYMDDDAYLAKGFGTSLFNNYLSSKGLICGGGLVKNANSNNVISRIYHDLYFEPVQLGLNLTIGTNMFFKRLTLEKIGGFSLTLNRADEAFVLNKMKLIDIEPSFHKDLVIYHEQPKSFRHISKVFYYNGYYRKINFDENKSNLDLIRNLLHLLLIITGIFLIISPWFLLIIIVRFFYGKFFEILKNLNPVLFLPALAFNFYRYVLEDLGYIKALITKNV